MKELTELMLKYARLKANLKELKSLADETRTNILIQLKTNDLDTYEDEGYALNLSKSNRHSFNKDQAIEFIAEHGANPETFFTDSEVEILKIKATGGEPNE